MSTNLTEVSTRKCVMCTGSFTVRGGGAQRNCSSCRTLSGEAHKAANQLKKAFKISKVLVRHGVGAAVAAEMHGSCWEMAAELAGVNAPGEDGVTKALVITLLAGASE